MKTGTKSIIAIVAALTVAHSCGFDSPVLNSLTELGPDYVQKAAAYELYGQAFGLPGGQVELFSPNGAALPQFSVAADSAGVFRMTFPGTTEYRNVLVQVTQGVTRLWGLALSIPRNENVWERFGPYHLGATTLIKWADGVPLMANIDDRTTALTLVLLRRAQVQGISLGAVSPESMHDAMAVVVQRITSASGPTGEVLSMVRRILAQSAQMRNAPAPFAFPDPAGLFLAPEFLAEADFDYTGDGYSDATATAFAAALDAAGEGLQLFGCKTEDRVTVVFQTALGEGLKDSNCSPVNPFKFAKNESGKTLFITGAMFTGEPSAATPACDGAKAEECLTTEEWAEVNQALGNWVPNRIAMRDDGQGADAVAGDGIWTVAFDLPYIRTKDDAGHQRKGVRLGYKYTYGFAGSNWGGTEEWPGNNRILELDDVNGDGLVVRFDIFGDESSNKNVANVNQQLCGGNKNPWPEAAKPGCWSDFGENRIDTDDDCIPDSFPAPGAVTPNCSSGKQYAVGFLTQAFFPSSDAPKIASVLPGQGLNGGGFLVGLSGANFRPGMDCEINTADSESVVGNRFDGLFVPDPARLYLLAPHFLAEKANVTLLHRKEDGTLELSKGALAYNVAGKKSCSLVWPPKDSAEASGAVMQPSVPFLARMAGVDPLFDSALRVEVGMSPACCSQGDTCMLPYGQCVSVPDPRYEDGWSFWPMKLDTGCSIPDGSGLAQCDSAHQFVGSVVAPEGPARFRVAVRYSLDGGLSWDYCDLPGDGQQWATEDGFALKNAGDYWVDG